MCVDGSGERKEICSRGIGRGGRCSAIWHLRPRRPRPPTVSSYEGQRSRKKERIPLLGHNQNYGLSFGDCPHYTVLIMVISNNGENSHLKLVHVGTRYTIRGIQKVKGSEHAHLHTISRWAGGKRRSPPSISAATKMLSDEHDHGNTEEYPQRNSQTRIILSPVLSFCLLRYKYAISSLTGWEM